MRDKPGEESTDRAAPRGKPTPGANRHVSAIGASQAKTLTRLRSDADELVAADDDEDMAALPAATRTAEAATVSSARAAGRTAAAAESRPKGSSRRSARRAHLAIAQLEPWSVMKFAFVVSLIVFVIVFAAVSVVYGTLSALGVFGFLQHFVWGITSSPTAAGVDTTGWFSASRVLGYTALLGSLNIVLITVMLTIGAAVYNLTSRLAGGVEVTLRETE